MVSAAKRSIWSALAGTLIFHLLLLSLQSTHRGDPGFGCRIAQRDPAQTFEGLGADYLDFRLVVQRAEHVGARDVAAWAAKSLHHHPDCLVSRCV